MGGLSGLISSFTGSSGARAAGQAGRIQSQALLGAIPGIQEGVQQAVGGLQPVQQAGTQALSQKQALSGFTSPEAQQQAFAGFAESPGQRFIRERQERALLRNQAAIGGLGGGNIRTALQEQAAGIAAQQEGEQFNRLAGLSGRGQQAATDVGNLQLGGAQAVGNLQTQAAGARASGVLGAEQARAQGVSNILGTCTALAFLSDKKMKEDINDIVLKECYESVKAMPCKSGRDQQESGSK